MFFINGPILVSRANIARENPASIIFAWAYLLFTLSIYSIWIRRERFFQKATD